MELCVLGPLEVTVGGQVVPVGGARRRAVLAVLTLHANRVVPSERIIDAIWGDRPPKTAAKGLQVHISGLRRVLPAGAVRTEGAGYLLVVDESAIDANRFAAMVRTATEHRLAGDPAEAARLLRDALGLWRGPALAEFAFEDFARPDIGRLEELRMTAVEERVAADLALGRHAEVLGDVQALVAAAPLRERLWAQLLLALYRSGRQAEALRRYQECRITLGDELGIDPSPELRRLEELILRQSAELDWVPPDPRWPRPPSARTAAVTSNVPVPLTQFIGRSAETAAVERVLADAGRLVTLIGAGGAGKTRVALEVAQRLESRFDDGVWLVELAPVADAALVPDTVASALGVVDQPGASRTDALIDALRSRTMLIVLDNCEHVITVSAALAVSLLETCPGLRIVATSRQPLAAAGETTIAIAPLPVPETDADDPATIASADSVRLFVDRAQAASPGFELDPTNATVIARLCRRLDGIALAIELAAARTRTLGVEEIERRLDDGFRVLGAGPTSSTSRHKTLRALVDWSYGLLSPAESDLFERLGVFAGGFTIEAAGVVAPPVDGDDGDANTVDLLLALADKSLLTPGGGPGARFHMLDTIRAHALERLAASGAEAHARRAHLRWAADTADAVWRRRHAYPDGGITLLRAEQDNYRSALAWAERDDPATGLRLAVALELLWLLGGRYHEGRRWFSALLEAAPDAPASLRADAHRVQGRLSTYIGETSAAAGYFADGLRLARELGDRRIVANCLAGLAGAASELGDHEAAQPALEEAILLMQAEAVDRPEDRDIANDLRWCRDTLGSMHLAAARLDDARRAFDDMLRSARDYDDMHDIGYAIRRLADVSRAEGDLGAARAGYEEALVIQRELDDHNCIANTLFGLATLDEAEGALAAAQERLRETASLRELLGQPWQVTECLERLAAIAGAEGRFARAARLLGASHVARAAAPERQASPSTAAIALEEAARNQLGASEYRTEWLRGRETGWRAVTASE